MTNLFFLEKSAKTMAGKKDDSKTSNIYLDIYNNWLSSYKSGVVGFKQELFNDLKKNPKKLKDIKGAYFYDAYQVFATYNIEVNNYTTRIEEFIIHGTDTNTRYVSLLEHWGVSKNYYPITRHEGLELFVIDIKTGWIYFLQLDLENKLTFVSKSLNEFRSICLIDF